MNLLRPPVRFFAPRLFTQLSLSRSYITTHPASQLHSYSTRFSDFALEFYTFVADNYAPFYSLPVE